MLVMLQHRDKNYIKSYTHAVLFRLNFRIEIQFKGSFDVELRRRLQSKYLITDQRHIVKRSMDN